MIVFYTEVFEHINECDSCLDYSMGYNHVFEEQSELDFIEQLMKAMTQPIEE